MCPNSGKMTDDFRNADTKWEINIALPNWENEFRNTDEYICWLNISCSVYFEGSSISAIVWWLHKPIIWKQIERKTQCMRIQIEHSSAHKTNYGFILLCTFTTTTTFQRFIFYLACTMCLCLTQTEFLFVTRRQSSFLKKEIHIHKHVVIGKQSVAIILVCLWAIWVQCRLWWICFYLYFNSISPFISSMAFTLFAVFSFFLLFSLLLFVAWKWSNRR